MAQRIVTTLTDDLDGSVGEETLILSIDGKTVEIDLNKKNATKIRKAMAPFMEKGRTAKHATAGKVSPKKKKGGSGKDTAAIRTWAEENDFQVNKRGRIPADIVEAYDKANS